MMLNVRRIEAQEENYHDCFVLHLVYSICSSLAISSQQSNYSFRSPVPDVIDAENLEFV